MPERSRASRLRVVVAIGTVLLGIQIGASYALSLNEKPPAAPALESVSAQIGEWKRIGEQTMQPDVSAYLRPDDYIDWNYAGLGSTAQVNLFVAYFKSLKSGYGPHSPAVCLPGAGWKQRQSSVIHVDVSDPAGTIPVNEYILEKGNQNILVLYWYQNERRVWAEEFRAKIFMLPDLIRYHRSDAALVRIITHLESRDTDAAHADLLRFARQAYPLLRQQFASIQ